MMKKTFMLAIAMLTLCAGAKGQDNSALIVGTCSGLVQGIEQDGTQAFLGIPYAEVERFMPPRPVKAGEGVRVCDHWDHR